MNVIEFILIELCNSINFQFNPVEICMVIFDPNQIELNRTHNKIALRIDYISIKSKLLFSIFFQVGTDRNAHFDLLIVDSNRSYHFDIFKSISKSVIISMSIM